MEKFQHKVKVGTQERANFKFCGMNLETNEKSEIEITVAGDKQDLIKPIPRVTGRRGRDITELEETMVRSRIGALQWCAAICRPDLSFRLNHVLGEINSSRSTSVITEINAVIDDFKKYEDSNRITFKPMGQKQSLEVYGDSSFTGHNQQGVCVATRDCENQRINLVGWKSQKSDRRAWSILAAETHAAQYTMDRAIGIKTLMSEIGAGLTSVGVMTDNLSLKRVLYSGNPTQELRLRREVAILRDLMSTDNIPVVFVSTEEMLADGLTKQKAGGKDLRKAIMCNRWDIETVDQSNELTKEMMIEWGIAESSDEDSRSERSPLQSRKW